MIYSDESMQELWDQFVGLQGKCNKLITEYSEKEFGNEKAKNYVQYGFCRRLSLITRCIEKVFEVLPPDTEEFPDEILIHDVTIHLQAFVFNAYGCLDNLAHIWVLEENVTQENGNPLPPIHIGIGPKNESVLKSLPKEFAEYLVEKKSWYKNLESFRHALAHRIPPYIPPGYLTDEKEEKYLEIQMLINEALSEQNREQVNRLEKEKADLLEFIPIAAHSSGDSIDFLYFHPQMLKDFHTILELARGMLSCFDR